MNKTNYCKGVGTILYSLPYLEETKENKAIVIRMLTDILKNLNAYKHPDTHRTVRRALDRLLDSDYRTG